MAARARLLSTPFLRWPHCSARMPYEIIMGGERHVSNIYMMDESIFRKNKTKFGRGRGRPAEGGRGRVLTVFRG